MFLEHPFESILKFLACFGFLFFNKSEENKFRDDIKFPKTMNWQENDIASKVGSVFSWSSMLGIFY